MRLYLPFSIDIQAWLLFHVNLFNKCAQEALQVLVLTFFMGIHGWFLFSVKFNMMDLESWRGLLFFILKLSKDDVETWLSFSFDLKSSIQFWLTFFFVNSIHNFN